MLVIPTKLLLEFLFAPYFDSITCVEIDRLLINVHSTIMNYNDSLGASAVLLLNLCKVCYFSSLVK